MCVSKKELHKSGDIVIPKSKLQEDKQEPDDVFYDSEDDSDDEESDSNQDIATL